MRFKYELDHLDCALCTEISSEICPHLLCPYIMDNVNDLRRDPLFLIIVENAERCYTLHSPTLLYLKTRGFLEIIPEPSGPPAPKPYNHGVKPECEGCPYPRVGMTCHGTAAND